jgi:cytochrome c556
MTRKQGIVAGAKILVTAALVVGVIGVAANRAYAQQQRESPGERAVEYRQSLMTVLAGNFGPVIAMATGRMPFNAALASKSAERAAFIATMAPDAFPANSNGAGKTKAKPNIWTDQADFQKHMQDLLDKTAALQVAAKSGDLAGIKTAANAAGEACKNCHDEFRAK